MALSNSAWITMMKNTLWLKTERMNGHFFVLSVPEIFTKNETTCAIVIVAPYPDATGTGYKRDTHEIPEYGECP